MSRKFKLYKHESNIQEFCRLTKAKPPTCYCHLYTIKSTHTLNPKLGTNFDAFGRSFCEFCLFRVLKTNSCEYRCMVGGWEIRLPCVSITYVRRVGHIHGYLSLVKKEREVTSEMTPHTSPKISIDLLPMFLTPIT